MARAARIAHFSQSDVDDMHMRLIKESLHKLGDGRNGQQTRDDILGWVMEEGMWPFSFDACCAFLAVNPDRMRQSIARLVRKCD